MTKRNANARFMQQKGEVKYMLRTIQYSFPSKADGLEISCLAVVPELERNEKYRGIIQIVHGMSEYKERYIPFMEYMAERKIYKCDP